MPPPAEPKIYHIVHVDRLASIIADGSLWCDIEIQQRPRSGTTIGMNKIKQLRRDNPVQCHPGLQVSDCVPFYFCPRSVMLYVIFCNDHLDLDYRGGQEPIVHLEADLHEAVEWAEQNQQRWAFTLSNAGSLEFESRCDPAHLGEIDWNAVKARDWRDPETKESKQAEFLVEQSFPWTLVRRIGVQSHNTGKLAYAALQKSDHRPKIIVQKEWYY